MKIVDIGISRSTHIEAGIVLLRIENRRQREREILLQRKHVNHIGCEIYLRCVSCTGAIRERSRLPSLDTQQKALAAKSAAQQIGISVIAAALRRKLKTSDKLVDIGVLRSVNSGDAHVLIGTCGQSEGSRQRSLQRIGKPRNVAVHETDGRRNRKRLRTGSVVVGQNEILAARIGELRKCDRIRCRSL